MFFFFSFLVLFLVFKAGGVSVLVSELTHKITGGLLRGVFLFSFVNEGSSLLFVELHFAWFLINVGFWSTLTYTGDTV